VLAIYGQNFVAFGSNVTVSQGGTTWRLPDVNPTYWWNQNYHQINSSLPPNIAGNQYAAVSVSTSSGTSPGQSILISGRSSAARVPGPTGERSRSFPQRDRSRALGAVARTRGGGPGGQSYLTSARQDRSGSQSPRRCR